MAPRARGGSYRQNRTAERATGFEPVTSSLGSWDSTPELRPQTPPRCNTRDYRTPSSAARQYHILFKSNCLRYRRNSHAHEENGKPPTSAALLPPSRFASLI